MAETTEELRRMSTPERDGYGLDAKWRILAVIDSLHRIPKSRNHYLEKDLDVIFRDRFLMPAMAMDPHAATQIHEATGVPLAMLHRWRDHLEVDATWRPWFAGLTTVPIAAS
jgi:thioesterase domain-containing protein